MTRKPAKENTSYPEQQKQNEGGILLTALLFLALFSGVLLIILEDYQVSQNFYLESRDLYTMKTMKEMFLDEYYTKSEKITNPVEFSTGTITYKETDQLVISVTVNGNTIAFQEKLK